MDVHHDLVPPRPVVRPLTRPTARRSHVPPLGVTVTPGGVDVAVLASHAAAVDFCLIDVVRPDLDERDPERYAERRVPLHGPTYGVWHAHVTGVRPGQRYGFRTYGAWDPRGGVRNNPAKLLLDPYARGIVGTVGYGPQVNGAVSRRRVDDPDHPDYNWWIAERYGAADTTDSLPHVPHAVVMEQFPTAAPLTRPRIPWADTVIYEAHVRGFTMQNPAVPAELRGTYAGMAHPATIAYLKDLGITTLELLPIQAIASEARLASHGLTNYWGYATLSFFAPEPSYATKRAQEAGPMAVLDEVRGMVNLLHQADIEVLLDVVYNHTCEGGDDQLHISWRGLDNPVYYLHDGNSPAALADVTGTGNSLDFRRSRVVQMALDSLRYWASEVGVDGFRFDLATTLGRGTYGFHPDHPFLVSLQTDPVLNNLKLVMEPWDVGPGGWQTGNFPPPAAEWNDRFRDSVREFWLESAREGTWGRPMVGLRELTTRLSGSADLFGHSDPPLVRGPVASINFVCAHDGFTLADLVSFDHKHNWANGEDNHDGSSGNRSWNHGIEGLPPTGGNLTAPPWSKVVEGRRRSQRNLLAMLILAAGTPMLAAGDELSRSQDGNNNAYAQDNPVSWVDWDLDEAAWQMHATTRHLLRLRAEHPALRADSFFLGTSRPGEKFADLLWYTETGLPMNRTTWDEPSRRVVQMLRPGPQAGDSDVLLVVNDRLEPLTVSLPPTMEGATAWRQVWASEWDSPTDPRGDTPPKRHAVPVEALSVQVWVAARAANS
ncbi:MAG: glycogen debranching protein GlgX [Promicromonosporaceae bacterium]|nr:glycogen debranching protein GlgX [Promicromonosporaceae bacterium]